MASAVTPDCWEFRFVSDQCLVHIPGRDGFLVADPFTVFGPRGGQMQATLEGWKKFDIPAAQPFCDICSSCHNVVRMYLVHRGFASDTAPEVHRCRPPRAYKPTVATIAADGTSSLIELMRQTPPSP